VSLSERWESHYSQERAPSSNGRLPDRTVFPAHPSHYVGESVGTQELAYEAGPGVVHLQAEDLVVGSGGRTEKFDASLLVYTNLTEGTMATADELAQARIDASEARTDTKIVRLEGKLDTVLNDVRAFRDEARENVRAFRDEARDNRRAVIANQWVIFGSVVVILGILITITPVIFDLGFKWRETITKEVQEQIRPH
jgi:hypothetical protein